VAKNIKLYNKQCKPSRTDLAKLKAVSEYRMGPKQTLYIQHQNNASTLHVTWRTFDVYVENLYRGRYICKTWKWRTV